MKVVVVGAGIAGMACSRRLADAGVSVTLLESEPRLGGHTATVDVDRNEQSWAIDTGFIVLNDRTYPNLMALFERLQVPIQPTEMSFSVTRDSDGLCYNGHDLNSLYVHRRNLVSPRFQRFVLEILRFNRLCKALVRRGDCEVHGSLDELLEHHRFSAFFRDSYVVPMVAAIWSASERSSLQMPASFFLRFFDNHGLLDLVNRPQWYSVVGGSRSYIQPLLDSPLIESHCRAAVHAVQRRSGGVEVRCVDGRRFEGERVVLACHADQALSVLEEPSAQERSVLGAFSFQDNAVSLHQDTAVLPERRLAWASWNYHAGAGIDSPPTLSYYMNRLQCLPEQGEPFIVSLNCADQVDSDRCLGHWTLSHPVFDAASVAAQKRWGEIDGEGGVHYAGAWWFNGFHEDGVVSGFRAADAILAGAAA